MEGGGVTLTSRFSHEQTNGLGRHNREEGIVFVQRRPTYANNSRRVNVGAESEVGGRRPGYR